jgi:hypothetical protein
MGLKEQALETAAEALNTVSRIIRQKSLLLFTLGNTAVLYAELQEKEKTLAVVNQILARVAENTGRPPDWGAIMRTWLKPEYTCSAETGGSGT